MRKAARQQCKHAKHAAHPLHLNLRPRPPTLVPAPPLRHARACRRHFVAWMGSVPATRGNFKRILKKGSVAVVVGGIAEMWVHARRGFELLCCGV